MNRSVVALFATLASLAVILLAVAVPGSMGDGRALASHVGCGAAITTDTTLDSDLVDCPNSGIVIGADDVKLDLNGHTIDGDGTPAVGCNPRKEFCDVGVLNRGHDAVTVRHGSVREFNVGVWGLGVSQNRLLGIASSGNQCCGLGFFRGTRSLVRNSSGSDSGEGGNGMFLFASHHVRILDSSFRHNGDQGIIVGDSTHNLIKGNLFSHNRVLRDRLRAVQPQSGEAQPQRSRRRSRDLRRPGQPKRDRPKPRLPRSAKPRAWAAPSRWTAATTT